MRTCTGPGHEPSDKGSEFMNKLINGFPDFWKLVYEYL